MPSRERAGLSHPHSVDAAVGSPLSQVSGVCSASPNKTEFGDLGVEHSSPRPVKASAGVRNVRNDAPAPAGNSREPHDESGRLLPEPTNPTKVNSRRFPNRGSSNPSADKESVDDQTAIPTQEKRRSSRRFPNRDLSDASVDSESVDDPTLESVEDQTSTAVSTQTLTSAATWASSFQTL